MRKKLDGLYGSKNRRYVDKVLRPRSQIQKSFTKSGKKELFFLFSNSLGVQVPDDGEADDDEDDEGDLIARTDQGGEGQGVCRRPENVAVNLNV